MLDHEVIEKFKEFQKKTGKYKDLVIEDVRFEKLTINDIVTEFIKGSTPKYSMNKSNTIVIKSGQARGNYNDFNFTKIAYLDLIKVKTPKYLKKGDILINTTGVGTAGRVTLFDLEDSYVSDSHITVLRYDLNKINKFYLLYFFKNFGFKKLESMAEGSGGQVELSMSNVKSISIPIPKDLNNKYTSLKLQKIIVEFLEYGFDWLDGIKANIDKQESVYKRLRKSLIPSTFKKDYIKIRFARYAKKYNIDFDITDVEFEVNDFDNFFETVTPPRKIKNKATKKIANFPVVSQSDGLINGYTDEIEGIIEAKDSPIILFGDHSTIVKYIDFNFFAGADGTKILKPLENILSLFAYYQTVNKVKQMGYQRHFQYLKEKKFLIPKSLKKYTSNEIQKIIADFIKEVDNEIQQSFDKIDKGHDAIERYKRAYLARTFSLINWSKA